MYEVVLLLSVVVFVVTAMAYVRGGLASIFHPFTFYLFTHGLIFVLRPIIVWVRDYRLIYQVYGFSPSLDDKVTVLVAANLGLLAFAFACLRAGNVPMLFRDGPVQRAERVQMSRLLPLLMLICVPLGTYSLLRTVGNAVSGTTSMVFTASGYKVNTTDIGYLSDAMFLLVPICGMFAWYHRFRWYGWLPLVLFVVLKASSGGRGAFVIALACALLFYFYDRKVKVPGVRLMIIGAALAMVFNMVGQDRGYAIRQLLGFEDKAGPQIGRSLRFLEGMDFANMEYFEFIVYVVPQRSGTYDYFLSNLQLLTEPIPRALWPGKPVGPPIKLMEFFDYGTPYGLSYTVPGVGWFEAGWIGVVLWSMLWGWATGTVYRRFVLGSQGALSVAAYLTFLPLMILAFRDGTILTVARTAVFFLSPPILLWLLGRAYQVPSLAGIAAQLDRAQTRAQATSAVAAPAMSRGRFNRLRLIASQTRREQV